MADETDRRRTVLSVTEEGGALAERLVDSARAVSAETLAPLTSEERDMLIRLLGKIG